MQKEAYRKLEKIEKDVETIKSMLSWQAGEAKKIVSLGGMLKGMQVGEQDIKEAKRSLFRLNGE